jgi:predicted AlkP superfamily pyrophosphatase or phosphodiesterase
MPPVVLVSIDGFSAALAADASLRLPALRGLAARGLSARGLRPAVPSVTWPCHTTLVTGVRPARHGILGNGVIDRTSGCTLRHEGDVCDMPTRVPTLWDAVAAAGLRAAALCWPKTRGVKTLADNVPEFSRPGPVRGMGIAPAVGRGAALGLPLSATRSGAPFAR